MPRGVFSTIKAAPARAAFLLSALCLIAGAQPALAGDVDSDVLPGIGAVIRIGGVISSGDDKKFHELVQNMSHPTVLLSGPGGGVDPALAIGVEVRNLRLTTLVAPEGSCASACSLIWVAGTTREMGANARIGLHAMSVGLLGGRRQESHDYDGALRTYLTWLGFANDTTAMIVNTPAALVRWMDASELNANGIDTQNFPP